MRRRPFAVTHRATDCTARCTAHCATQRTTDRTTDRATQARPLAGTLVTALLATVAAICIALLSGCAQLTPDAKHRTEASEQISGIDRHSAFPAISRSGFEQVNRVQMIGPRGLAQRDFPAAWASSKPDSEARRHLHRDGTCSTVVGLLEAADSIKEVNNPGLGRAAEVLASMRATHEIASAPRVSDLAESAELAKLLKPSNSVNWPRVVASVKPDLLISTPLPGPLAAASRARVQLDERVDQAGARLAQAFTQAHSELAKADQSSTLTAPGVKAAFVAAFVAAMGRPWPRLHANWPPPPSSGSRSSAPTT